MTRLTDPTEIIEQNFDEIQTNVLNRKDDSLDVVLGRLDQHPLSVSYLPSTFGYAYNLVAFESKEVVDTFNARQYALLRMCDSIESSFKIKIDPNQSDWTCCINLCKGHRLCKLVESRLLIAELPAFEITGKSDSPQEAFDDAFKQLILYFIECSDYVHQYNTKTEKLNNEPGPTVSLKNQFVAYDGNTLKWVDTPSTTMEDIPTQDVQENTPKTEEGYVLDLSEHPGVMHPAYIKYAGSPFRSPGIYYGNKLIYSPFEEKPTDACNRFKANHSGKIRQLIEEKYKLPTIWDGVCQYFAVNDYGGWHRVTILGCPEEEHAST